MIVLFAFLHHLAAFTLVAAVALEFVLLRGELTTWSARRLQVADMVLGIAASVLFVVGLARVVWFEKGAAYYFPATRSWRSSRCSSWWPALDRADARVPVLAQGGEGGAGAGGGGRKAQARAHDRAHRAGRDRADPAVRRHHGEGRMDLAR